MSLPVLLVLIATSATAVAGGNAPQPGLGLTGIAPPVSTGAAFCPTPVPGKVAGTFT